MFPSSIRTIAGIVFLAFLACSVLAGATPALGKDPVQVVFWHAMRGEKQVALAKLIEKFQKENPDVTVQEVAALSPHERGLGNDYNHLYLKLLQAVAQNTPPDLAQVYENWATQFIEIKAITPVEEFRKGKYPLTDKEKEDFFPIFREANSFNGALWTIPFNKSVYVLYYNRDMLEKNSIKVPRTWDELSEASKKLTVRSGDEVKVYGFIYTPSVDMFGHWLYAYGGEFISGDVATFGNARGVKDLEYWVQLTNSDRTALPSFNAYDDFLKGKGAFYIDSTSRIAPLMKHCPFSFGIASVPEGSERTYQSAGTNLAIFAKSDEKKEASWRFMRFLVAPENTAFWAINTGYLPVRQSAVKRPDYQVFLKSHPDFSVGIQSINYAKSPPRNPAWETIRNYINDAIYEAISQTATPTKALEKAVTHSNDLLKGMKGQ
ncbi:MAG: ABC transporter substrate-binding protein [Candidatus Eremiobacteraeota bacterium]|nr:ABC transporter substrate-binding protein [Candidatus Eremiobacteraeota bacterium]